LKLKLKKVSSGHDLVTVNRLKDSLSEKYFYFNAKLSHCALFSLLSCSLARVFILLSADPNFRLLPPTLALALSSLCDLFSTLFVTYKLNFRVAATFARKLLSNVRPN
jgi:hypothetical protein